MIGDLINYSRPYYKLYSFLIGCGRGILALSCCTSFISFVWIICLHGARCRKTGALLLCLKFVLAACQVFVMIIEQGTNEERGKHMARIDKHYLEYRRSVLRADAEQIKAHFAKYPASIADIKCDLQEYELVKEVFKEELDEKQLKRCTFVRKKA